MKVKGKLLQFNLYMLTKLQKISFGKIKKNSPTEARTHTNSEIIPTQLPSSLTPSTKASPPRCLHESSRQQLFINKHFKLLNKGKLPINL